MYYRKQTVHGHKTKKRGPLEAVRGVDDSAFIENGDTGTFLGTAL